MKKLLLSLSLLTLAISLLASPVYAVTATPSPTAAPSSTPAASKKAQDLYDRVATKVAELARTLRRAYTGKIKSLGRTSLVIAAPEGDRSVTTNDATEFYRIRAGSRSETAFANLKVNDDLSIVGTVDPNTLEMAARQIIAKIHRYNIVGTITAVDKDIYTVKEFNGPVSKINLADAVYFKKLEEGKFWAAKLADFKTGATVFIIAYSGSDPSILSALKAVVLVD